MSFLFKKSKKELNITDALIRKEATITIGGKPVVIRAFKLAKALQLMEALSLGAGLFKLASTNITEFNKYLLSKLPVIIDFCEIKDINIDDITLAEFSDLILAIYCVNDLERILINFTTAVQSMPKAMQGLAASPKQ